MKNIKLTLGIMAFLCLSVSTSTFASETESTIPTDLENHWSKSNVIKLMEKNVINGYEDGTFRPEAEITVAEFTKLLMVNNQIELGKKGSNWYDEYISGARELGLIQGGEFVDYDRAINRVEMAKLIDRALNLTGKPIVEYEDSKKFGSNVYYIRRVSNIGVINGYEDGTFRPYDNATRGEASTMIKRVNDYLDGDIIVPKVENIPEFNADGSWTDEWFLDNLENLERYTNHSNDLVTTATYNYNGKKLIVASNDRAEMELVPVEDEVMNERILAVLKYFTQKAYETNRYAGINQRTHGTSRVIVIDFSSERNIFSRGDFQVQFPLNPDEYMDGSLALELDMWTNQRVDIRWDIGKMFDDRTVPSDIADDPILRYNYIIESEYIMEPYKEIMEETFKLMYGDDYKEILDYIVKERTTELDNFGSYGNTAQVEINGYKIHNENEVISNAYFLSELK